MLSVSGKVLEKRFSANWDVLNQFHSTGKSVQIHVGHNFNWEWGNMIMTKKAVLKLLAVYMPLGNKIMEKLFYKTRTRYGAIFLRATHMKEDFLPYQKTQYILGLVADQSPGHPGNAWWFNFFGRPTPFLKGPAKAALQNNTAVVFAFIHKPRRGYYEISMKSPHGCSHRRELAPNKIPFAPLPRPTPSQHVASSSVSPLISFLNVMCRPLWM